MSSGSPPAPAFQHRFDVRDYDLDATFTSGQAFRWRRTDNAWEGVIHSRWVRVRHLPDGVQVETAEPQIAWDWAADYLQLELDLPRVQHSFPPDPALQAAVRAFPGLRLLRQDPWECLASFLLSSARRICQIEQCVEALCRRFGAPLAAPPGHPGIQAFPTPATLAAAPLSALRDARLGFRAPYLLEAAQRVQAGQIELRQLSRLPLDAARALLQELPGVGPKVADCVLLFSGGHPDAFPVDVWIARALRRHYFRNRRVGLPQLREFAARHFGPYAGFAQQYLFHSARLHGRSSG